MDYYINWGLCNLPTFKLPGGDRQSQVGSGERGKRSSPSSIGPPRGSPDNATKLRRHPGESESTKSNFGEIRKARKLPQPEVRRNIHTIISIQQAAVHHSNCHVALASMNISVFL